MSSRSCFCSPRRSWPRRRETGWLHSRCGLSSACWSATSPASRHSPTDSPSRRGSTVRCPGRFWRHPSCGVQRARPDPTPTLCRQHSHACRTARRTPLSAVSGALLRARSPLLLWSTPTATPDPDGVAPDAVLVHEHAVRATVTVWDGEYALYRLPPGAGSPAKYLAIGVVLVDAKGSRLRPAAKGRGLRLEPADLLPKSR